MRDEGEGPLHVMGVTRKLIRSLVNAPTGLGASLRSILNSPVGVGVDNKRSGCDPFPLPLTVACYEALQHFAASSFTDNGLSSFALTGANNSKKTKKDSWRLCPLAWCGLMVVVLNRSKGFTEKRCA